MGYFQLPWVPEQPGARPRVLDAARRLRARRASRARSHAEDLDRYVEAWSQPGALTGYDQLLPGALTPIPDGRRTADPGRLQAPTRVIWGLRDRYLGPELAEPRPSDVPDLERVFRLDASHWVNTTPPGRCRPSLTGFFGPTR